MAYITDQEFSRQQAESLARLMQAETKANALKEAQTIEPKTKQKTKRIKSNGSK